MRPSVLMRRNLQALSIIPAGARVCRQRHLVLPGSPGDPCMGPLLPSEAGEVAVLPTVQIKAPEATLGIWVPREVPTCCWYLLLGQERAAVGFHLFQSLHEVAVAYLKLFCFVQCRAKLSLELPFFRL